MADSSKRKFFLCPPTYFDIEYVINDWMDAGISVDKSKAQAQWEKLYEVYQRFDVDIEVLDPIEGLPDLVFPGDAVFLYQGHAVGSNMRFKQRAPEVAPRLKLFAGKGYTTHTLPEGIKFEGNAEAVRWNGNLFGGYGVRSDQEVYPLLAEMLDIEIVPLKIKAPYFHLDVALTPLDKKTIAYAPDAFDREDRQKIEAHVPRTIQVSKEEAMHLAVNSITIDDTVVLSTTKAPKFEADLKELGFNTIALDMSEFLKSGGGVKCLTLEEYNGKNAD